MIRDEDSSQTRTQVVIYDLLVLSWYSKTWLLSSFNGRCYVDACTCRNFWRFNVDVAALLYMLTFKQYSRENRRCRKRSDLVKVFDKFVEQLKELLKDDIEKAGHRPVLYLLSTYSALYRSAL